MEFPTADSRPSDSRGTGLAGTDVGKSTNAKSPAWTPAEDEVISLYYNQSGSAGCLKLLPRRSPIAIQTRASRLGIELAVERRGYMNRAYEQNDVIDRIIIDAYQKPVHGVLKRLAYRLGRSQNWVQKRASQLGCRVKLVHPWTDVEKAVLAEYVNKPTKQIQIALRKVGSTKRSFPAIRFEIKRRGLFRDLTDPNVYSIAFITEMTKVHRAVINGWIERGLLRAKRTGTSPTSMVAVRRRDLYAFVRENPTLIDLRKVDQVWFMDLLLSPRDVG